MKIKFGTQTIKADSISEDYAVSSSISEENVSEIRIDGVEIEPQEGKTQIQTLKDALKIENVKNFDILSDDGKKVIEKYKGLPVSRIRIVKRIVDDMESRILVTLRLS